VCIVLAAAGAQAGDDATQAPASAVAKPGPSPKVEIAALEHEFGKVKPGTPLTYTFKIQNKGNADLAIEDVKPSCGCTKGDFDKLIKPGKSGKITLTIDKTDKYVGKTVKTARVTTNDPEHATFTLTLRADFIGTKPDAPATQ
jgi:hypothetical protein